MNDSDTIFEWGVRYPDGSVKRRAGMELAMTQIRTTGVGDLVVRAIGPWQKVCRCDEQPDVNG